MVVKYSLTYGLNRDIIPVMVDTKRMRLDLEFRRIGHTQDSWCRQHGVHKTTFSSVLNGHRNSRPLLKKLETYPALYDAVVAFIKSKKEERTNVEAKGEKAPRPVSDNS